MTIVIKVNTCFSCPWFVRTDDGDGTDWCNLAMRVRDWPDMVRGGIVPWPPSTPHSEKAQPLWCPLRHQSVRVERSYGA